MASSFVRRLEGKVALITGAASGIGESTAKLFSKHGAKVVIADIQDDLAEKVCKNLGSSTVTFVHCDVTKESDVENAVKTAVATYGKLDILHNNAGIGPTRNLSIMDTEKSEFEHIMRVNLIGTFLGTKYAARAMTPNGSGSIITTASVASIVGGGSPHCYVSSKHAVVGLMKNASVELGNYGIRVNCVSPYLVETPLSSRFYNFDRAALNKAYPYLRGAVLSAEDVAEAAVYLASDESKYVSGHNLVVDGGFSIVNQGFNLFGVAESANY